METVYYFVTLLGLSTMQYLIAKVADANVCVFAAISFNLVLLILFPIHSIIATLIVITALAINYLYYRFRKPSLFRL